MYLIFVGFVVVVGHPFPCLQSSFERGGVVHVIWARMSLSGKFRHNETQDPSVQQATAAAAPASASLENYDPFR